MIFFFLTQPDVCVYYTLNYVYIPHFTTLIQCLQKTAKNMRLLNVEGSFISTLVFFCSVYLILGGQIWFQFKNRKI